MELNEDYISQMKELLKGDYEKYENSLSLPAKRGVKVFDEKAFCNLFSYATEKIDGLDGCYKLLSDEKVGNTLAHHLGIIYLQEPSSMLAPIALDVKEGEKVLDLCSAPGGKASHILSKNKSGIVVLNEVVRQRANILFSNIERLGFKNAIITSTTPEKLACDLPNFFDKILVDAPCSGEGMFRKEPETILQWNRNIKYFNHERQMKILESADKMLKEGGILVYSTCTFNLVENENTILKFCEKFGYDLLPLGNNIEKYVSKGFELEGNKKLALCGRCFPQDDFGEGQFVAKLIKKSVNDNVFCEKQRKNPYTLGKNEQKIAKQLVFECINRENFEFYRVGNYIYLYDKPIKTIENIVSIGVCLAKIEKGRLAIQHQFFKAFGKEFRSKLVLKKDDNRIKEFCFGNEIDCGDVSGYVAVMVEDNVLGGGKAVNGKLKNYYPKGLRAKIL